MSRDYVVPPFESIESAHEYVGLLCDALDDAAREINEGLYASPRLTDPRDLDAMRLTDYKLKSLRQHLLTSRRLLNDLRTLRRYLLGERATSRDLATPHGGRDPLVDERSFGGLYP